MKNTTLLIIILFSCTFAYGQALQTRAKFPVKGKQIIIDVQEATLTVEGYDGDDLIVEPETPPMAAKAIPNGFSLVSSGLGVDDKFIHYEVLNNEPNLFSLRLLSIFNNGLNFRHFHIKVPQKAHLKVIFVISELGAKMSFKNLDNELEVEGTAPIIEFSNITGPLTLSEGVSGHRIGGTEKIIISHLQIPKTLLADNEDTPFLNIITSYGDVDISLPGDTKATVQVDAHYGNLFSDLNMIQQRPAFPMVKNRYTGNLNSGGRMIAINTTYGNVFIRKEK